MFIKWETFSWEEAIIVVDEQHFGEVSEWAFLVVSS